MGLELHLSDPPFPLLFPSLQTGARMYTKLHTLYMHLRVDVNIASALPEWRMRVCIPSTGRQPQDPVLDSISPPAATSTRPSHDRRHQPLKDQHHPGCPSWIVASLLQIRQDRSLSPSKVRSQYRAPHMQGRACAVSQRQRHKDSLTH
jgi:hypothetical protein